MAAQVGFARIGRIMSAAGLAGILIAGLSMPITGYAAGGGGRHTGQLAPARVAKQYTIVSLTPGTPNTMVVQPDLAGSPQITVTISPTATIVRRYNGKSAFTELSVNDHVQVWPVRSTTPGATTPVTGTTSLVAARIKDVSIQLAFTQISGKVTAISLDKTQVTVLVTANRGANVSAFMVGKSATLDVTPTTVVHFGKKTGTVADLQVGMILRTWGLSDSVSGIMLA
jgi:hypothetical protein